MSQTCNCSTVVSKVACTAENHSYQANTGKVVVVHVLVVALFIGYSNLRPSSNKKLLVTKGIATRSKKLLVAPGLTSY